MCACVCDGGVYRGVGVSVCVRVCVMEVSVEQKGLEECQDRSLYSGEKEQSGARRQGFLCAPLVPQRLGTGPQLAPKYLLWIWCEFLPPDPPQLSRPPCGLAVGTAGHSLWTHPPPPTLTVSPI